MKDCYKYKAYFNDYIDGNISETLKKQLLMHLEICERCRIAVKEMISAKKALKSLSTVKTSPSFDIVLKSKIRKEARKRNANTWFAMFSPDSLRLPAYAFSAAALILIGVVLDRTVFESNLFITEPDPLVQEQIVNTVPENFNALETNTLPGSVATQGQMQSPEYISSYDSYYANTIKQLQHQSNLRQTGIKNFQTVGYSNSPVSSLKYDDYIKWLQNRGRPSLTIGTTTQVK